MASGFEMATVLEVVSTIHVGPGLAGFVVGLAVLAWIARGTGEHLRCIAAREWDTRNGDVTGRRE
jgi:hypothetical protein